MKTFFFALAFVAVLLAIFWAPAWLAVAAFVTLAIINPS